MRAALFIGALLCSAAIARGQASPVADRPLAEVDYRPAGKLIYVPVQVNGSVPLLFCFDAGAPNSVIDEAVARRLNIRTVSSGIIHGAGKGDVPAGDAGEVSFRMGGLDTRVPHAKSSTCPKCGFELGVWSQGMMVQH